MQEHPNAMRIRELFAAFRTGDLDTIQDIMAEDIVWHFPGKKGQLVGDHRGRKSVFAFLMNVRALTEGTFNLELIDVLANGENAVALFRGHGRRGNRALDNPTCLRMRMRDGRVAEAWEFVWNLFDVDEFWA